MPSDPRAYVTIGASMASEGCGTEFFILSPTEYPGHVETLAMVASFHADPRYRLTVGSTVNVGRPCIDDSPSDHLLVSLPYPYGPRLEHCELPGRHVRILWLVPVTATEARYVGAHGFAALEQLLERSNVDVIAPSRASLV